MGESSDFGMDSQSVASSTNSRSDECKLCSRLMSHMRKTAIRWLYLEWYKKAVLGQPLSAVSTRFNDVFQYFKLAYAFIGFAI